MNLLRVHALGKSFAGLRALDNVSFEVAPEEVVGIMGANGAGKTTLFSIIAGHQRASQGEVHFAGRRIGGLRPDRICRLGIARTFQIVRPFANLSVRENVEIALLYGSTRRYAGAALAARALAIVETVGLGPRAGQLAGTLTLSGRKRLEVARALGTEPRLLLLDEVMAGLTPAEVGEMLDTVRTLRREYGLTLLVIEHVVRALVQLSDRIIVLHHGELIAQGAPAEVARDTRVLQVYFGEQAP